MRPDRVDAGALLPTPGAGAGRDQRTLLAVEQAVSPLPCERMDFPYRLAGRRVPGRPDDSIAAVVARAAAVAGRVGIEPGRLVLGGRSYGGRMCSLAVAQGLPAAGLVLLSYPLHPPGRPERLRTEHFPDIGVPVLFVSGSSDPFGSPTEFDREVATVAGPVTQIRVAGGHDPRGLVEIGRVVTDWIASL